MTAPRRRLHPTSVDYARAVQRPDDVFRAERYRRAVFEVGLYGQPAATSGAFAVVFKARVEGTPRALRFLTQHVESSRSRYGALTDHFRARGLVDLVALCEWHDDAVVVKGESWPMIDMEWIEGSILDRYVAALVAGGNTAALVQLAAVFREAVGRLQRAEFAHGDLQPGNIMIDEHGRLRLVDFDGSWAPAVAGRTEPNERGHPDFQHPGRTWGRWMDTFPALVIHVSLLALARDPRLWPEFNTANNLILTSADLADPNRPVWHRLRALGDPELDRATGALERLCRQAAPPEVGLEEVLAGGGTSWGADRLSYGGVVPAGGVPPVGGPAGSDQRWWDRPARSAETFVGGGPVAEAGPPGTPAPSAPFPGPDRPDPTAPAWSGPSAPGPRPDPLPANTLYGPGTGYGPGGYSPGGFGPGGGYGPAGGHGPAGGYGPGGYGPGPGDGSGPGGATGPVGGAGRRRRRLALLAGALGLVVVVLLGFLAFPFGFGSGGVTLLAATDAAPSAFGTDYTRGNGPPGPPPPLPAPPPRPRPRAGAGAPPPHHAGPRGPGASDRDGLAGYVSGSADRQAWVSALTADAAVRWPAGGEQSAVVDFVKGLTPAVLRADTLVTSHRFAFLGRTRAEPTVLQAGTVVLVDARGAPRVRCSGAAPLTRADPGVLTDDAVSGTRWSGFAVSGVQVLDPADADVTQFVLAGVSEAAPFRRPAGTAGDKDFLPAPENALPAGSYRVTATSVQDCEGVNNCGVNKPSDEITLTCTDTCTASSRYWTEKLPVTLQGARWTISGKATDDYAFNCGGVISPTTIEVDLSVRSGTVEAGAWVADRLAGSLTRTAPPTKCTLAKEAWSASAART